MVEAIATFCKRTGQSMPQEHGSIVRAVIEGIALRYRAVLNELEEIVGKTMPLIHMVGGGIQNRLLCQMAADATGRPVMAGPVEATAIGNIVVQAVGTGRLASFTEARDLVRRSVEIRQYEPRQADAWDEAYARYVRLVQNSP
jgi:rhamnulokinase